MDRSFQLPQNPQNGSRLLALPAELRIKILRLLMRHENPLLSLAEISHGWWEERRGQHFARGKIEESRLTQAAPIYNSMNCLSSQIFSTCQQLFIEGHSVLYGENTLSICVSDGFSAFDCTLKVPLVRIHASDSNQNILESAHQRLQELADGSIPWLSDTCGGSEEIEGLRKLIQIYPQMKSFNRFRVVVDIGGKYKSSGLPYPAIMLRLLKGVLDHKGILIRLQDKGRVIRGNCREHMFFRCLESRGIKFELAQDVELEFTINCITGKEKFQDILWDWSLTYRRIIEAMTSMAHFKRYHKDMIHIWMTACFYDPKSYQEAKLSAVRKFKDYLELKTVFSVQEAGI